MLSLLILLVQFLALSGGAKVESPYVENGVIKRWEAVYRPDRAYAVDMAGFAVNLKLILQYKK